jgi:DNA helicase HerA-like ATPase
LNIRRQVDLLGGRLRDPRYAFLFEPGDYLPSIEGEAGKDLPDLLNDWIGDASIAVLDLSGIPSLILNDLVGAVLRIVYDALFWGRYLPEGGRRRPLLFVLEEAHAYLGHDSADSAKVAVRRIVKEGRKYGVGAMVVSQRPSEIDQTILSQCGTMFALRLSNSTDRGHVTATVTDHLEGLLEMLPILRTGEAIVLGEAVHLPMRMITVPPASRYPESSDPLVTSAEKSGGWDAVSGVGDYAAVAAAWRALDARFAVGE